MEGRRIQEYHENMDGDAIIVCASLIAASSIVIRNSGKQKRRRRTTWVKGWLKTRAEKGAYNTILNELKLSDFESFRRYLRMNTETFEVRNLF